MFYVDHDLGIYMAKDYKKYLEKNVKFSGMEIGQSKEALYAYGWFLLMYGRNQGNIVKQLSFN